MKYFFILSIIISNIVFSDSISGIVIDENNQKPIENANIYLPALNKGTLSDSNGEFNISNLPDSKIQIQISYIGYESIIRTVHSNSKNLRFELSQKSFRTEEIVVSGGSYSSQHENAIKIDMIKTSELKSSGTPNLMESISKVPGVDMIAKGPGVAKPVIRGLSMTNILMLNNGVKLENFQFSENHPFLIDEYGTDRIEIIKGPASLLYGSDAVGGVINILKEKPAPVGKVKADFSSSYFSNTNGIHSSIGLKGSEEKFSWGIRGSIKSNSDYSDGNGDFVPNTRFNEYGIKANIGINESFGIFRIYYDYNRPKYGMSIGNAIPLINEKGRTNEYWYQNLTNHLISSKNSFFYKDYKFDLNLSYQFNNRRLETDTTTPKFTMVDMDLSTFSYEFKINLPTDNLNEYIFGIQGANKINRNNNAPNHVLPDANVNDISAFGLFQKKFLNKLKGQFGLRYDYRNIYTEEEANKIAVDNDYGNFSASVGGTYQFTEHFLIRTNIASAYRTPNIAELTQNGIHGNRFERGNPDLNSQRNYEADASIHYHNNYVMVDIAGFYNSISGYIYIAPTDEYINENNQIFEYTQSDANILGGEITSDIMPVNWINLNIGYSYILGKRTDGSYLPFIPQNKLYSEIKLFKNNLFVFDNPYLKLYSTYAFRQNNPSQFETITDDYFLLNVGVGFNYSINNYQIDLSVQGRNLLNEIYYDHLSTLKGLGLYNIGRNISLNIRIF